MARVRDGLAALRWLGERHTQSLVWGVPSEGEGERVSGEAVESEESGRLTNHSLPGGELKLTIAEKLMQEIAASNVGVDDLANQSGVPQPALYRFVHGQRDLTLKNTDKLASHFRLELVKLPGIVR